MATSSSTYLLRDEYIDSQNKQNSLLSHELSSIRNSICQVSSELKEVKESVQELRADASKQIQDLRADTSKQIQELRAESMQMSAVLRNNNLHNPTLSIRPVVAFRPGQGIIEPDRKYFPKHANEFYSMRSLESERQRRMLTYLADFYDIIPHHGQQSDSESSDRESIIERPDLVVEQLEMILGLRESNFDQFRLKAHQMAQQSMLPRPNAKRSRVSHFGDCPIPPRPKIGASLFPQHGEEEDAHSSRASKETRLEWRIGSSPSDRKRWRKFRDAVRQAQAENDSEETSSDAGTTTNPNTSSRELSEAQEN